MTSFVVENVRPARGGAGDRQRREHAGRRQPERLREIPDGPGFEKGSAGTAGVGAELAVGLSVAQQIMKQQSGTDATPSLTGVLDSGAGRRHPRRRGDRRYRDLEKGDLKGKKIGNAWRVTRAAVDQFLGS